MLMKLEKTLNYSKSEATTVNNLNKWIEEPQNWIASGDSQAAAVPGAADTENQGDAYEKKLKNSLKSRQISAKLSENIFMASLKLN